MRVLIALFAALAACAAAAADFPPVRIEKINERVVALLGPTEIPNPQNGGYANNNLAIIGERGVVLVDAGSHRPAAEHILRALRTVTDKPVTHVLITHFHADHHLGLSAFPGAKVIATQETAAQIAKGGRGMVNWMKLRSGLPLADTQPVTPDTLVPSNSKQSLALEGVRVELIATGMAHTNGDLVVWLPDDGVLAAGDILVSTINPNFADGDLKKMLAVLGDLLALPFKTAVPGHGPLMARPQVEEFRGLATDFYRTVESVYKAGGAESDVRRKLDLQRWQKLGRFEDMMGRNISAVWLQVERDNF